MDYLLAQHQFHIRLKVKSQKAEKTGKIYNSKMISHSIGKRDKLKITVFSDVLEANFVEHTTNKTTWNGTFNGRLLS